MDTTKLMAELAVAAGRRDEAWAEIRRAYPYGRPTGQAGVGYDDRVRNARSLQTRVDLLARAIRSADLEARIRRAQEAAAWWRARSAATDEGWDWGVADPEGRVQWTESGLLRTVAEARCRIYNRVRQGHTVVRVG